MALLIQHGADVHVEDDHALLVASLGGHVDVVALLIQHGANVNPQTESALQHASLNGHTDVVALLIQHGATTLAEVDEGQEDACFRCGRRSHWATYCYARTSVTGQMLH